MSKRVDNIPPDGWVTKLRETLAISDDATWSDILIEVAQTARLAKRATKEYFEKQLHEHRSLDGDGQRIGNARNDAGVALPRPKGGGPSAGADSGRSAGVVIALQGDERLHGSATRDPAAGSEPADAHTLSAPSGETAPHVHTIACYSTPPLPYFPTLICGHGDPSAPSGAPQPAETPLWWYSSDDFAIRHRSVYLASDVDAALDALRADLERERMRLAACTTAALGNTAETAAQRIGRDHPYWSASYGDMCKAVDREMALRDENASLRTRQIDMDRERDLDAVAFDNLAAERDTLRAELVETKRDLQLMENRAETADDERDEMIHRAEAAGAQLANLRAELETFRRFHEERCSALQMEASSAQQETVSLREELDQALIVTTTDAQADILQRDLKAAEGALSALRAERDEAMAVLAPNMPENSLVDACRQVKQAAISEADNSVTLEAQLAALQVELRGERRLRAVDAAKHLGLQANIDGAWDYIKNGYDIEDRAFFEREYTQGFTSPLQMALHHIWKRNPKVAALQATHDALIASLTWQPIASAPHDGSRFIGGFQHNVYGWLWGPAQFFDEDKHGNREPYAVMDGGGAPTHWIPGVQTILILADAQASPVPARTKGATT